MLTLHSAITSNNENEVRRLLNETPKLVNQQDENGLCPLKTLCNNFNRFFSIEDSTIIEDNIGLILINADAKLPLNKDDQILILKKAFNYGYFKTGLKLLSKQEYDIQDLEKFSKAIANNITKQLSSQQIINSSILKFGDNFLESLKYVINENIQTGGNLILHKNLMHLDISWSNLLCNAELFKKAYNRIIFNYEFVLGYKEAENDYKKYKPLLCDNKDIGSYLETLKQLKKYICYEKFKDNYFQSYKAVSKKFEGTEPYLSTEPWKKIGEYTAYAELVIIRQCHKIEEDTALEIPEQTSLVGEEADLFS